MLITPMRKGVGQGDAEKTGRETVPAGPPPRTCDFRFCPPHRDWALLGLPAQREGERTGVQAMDVRGSRDTRVDPES